jgi:hypothetical protein
MGARIALIVIASIYAVLGRQQAFGWQSDRSLWSHAVTVGTPTYRARANYEKAVFVGLP